MSKAHGKWTSWLSRFYYISGSIYYGYHWFLILGGVSVVASGILGYLKEWPVWSGILLVLGLAGITAGISFWRRLAKFRLQSHNPGLNLKKVVIDYSFKDATNCDYTRGVIADVIFPTEYYEARFHWSGQGAAHGKALKGAVKVEIYDHQSSVDNVCRVHFGDTLPKGTTHHFIYQLELRNAPKPIRPFLGHTVDAAMDELVLRVYLLPNHGIKQYKRQFFISCDSNLHLWEDVIPIENPGNNLLDWTIPKPGNYYYRISW